MTPERYGNTGGDAGVSHYAIGTDFIAVQFTGPEVYIYDYDHSGMIHVTRMKQLAAAGRGLSTYISQQVRDQFARKVASWSDVDG